MKHMDLPTSPISPLSPVTMPEPEPAMRSARGKRVALISAATVLAAGVGGAAYAVVSFLSGGGTQPEQVLPAGAVAFAKIDLDPAANQKVAVYKLTRKFPQLARQNGDEERALKDSVVASGFEGTELSYDRDIKPWLGDRAAFAVYAPPSKGADPEAALAVAYTDEAKMTAAMRKMAAANDEFGWTTRDGYVVISDTTEHAKDLAAKSEDTPLAEQGTFRNDTDALDGDQIAVAWADLGGIYQLAEHSGEDLGQFDFLVQPGEEITGRVAFGLHAANEYIEVQAKTYGVSAGQTASGLGTTAGTNLAETMPADSVATISATGLGQVLADAWTEMAKHGGDPFGVGSMAEQIGLSLPGDFRALFGTETALAVSGAGANNEPHITIRSRGGDPTRAGEIANILTQSLLGGEAAVEKTSDGIVVGDDATTVRSTANGTNPLRGSDTYRLAVPDAKNAGVILYANVGQMIDEWGKDDEDAQKVKALSAVGFTATGGKDSTLRLRITVR
jgi:hypothetical protein